MIADDLVDRKILTVAIRRCVESPVVLLEGPRTVGKSTLLQALAERLGGEVLDLDDVDVRAAVATDPATMIDTFQLGAHRRVSARAHRAGCHQSAAQPVQPARPVRVDRFGAP